MNIWRSKIVKRLKLLRQIRRPGDFFLFMRIFWFAAAVPLLMRLKLPRLEKLLEPRNRHSAADPATVQKIVSYTNLAQRFGHPLVRRRCLTRGLTLYYFLRKAGLDVTLTFGVENVSAEFAGHCWLVKAGEPYLEAEDPRPLYASIYSMPDTGQTMISGDRSIQRSPFELTTPHRE